MLQSLHVKNLALIDEVEIEFTKGLNILTGETGAGKSLIIGSINMALGDKADASYIREGEDYALIEMIFKVEDPSVIKRVEEMELSLEGGSELILTRRIMKNRSSCKVCGESVTLKTLRELSHLLINIHGQNDQQTLLSKKFQREILDFYSKKSNSFKKEVKELWNKYQEEKRLYEDSDIDNKTRLKEIDLINYEISEIEEAGLTVGEDENLEAKFKKLSNSKKISDSLTAAKDALISGDINASDLLGAAYKNLTYAQKLDESIGEYISSVKDAQVVIEDVSRGLEEYLFEIEDEDLELDAISDRLNLINRLKQKYASLNAGIDKILEYKDERRKNLEKLIDLEAFKEEKKAAMEKYRKRLIAEAKKLSDERIKVSKELSGELETALKELNFDSVKFNIEISTSEENLSSEGMDEIEFMISVNSGEKQKPLNKVASGGELSRIMLALKTVFSENNDSVAMIFDEIDSGISGKTAWRVSLKLGELAKQRQVICITHLAQIASMADTHFMIHKEAMSGRTVTNISRLNDNESINELARLLGTDGVSDTAISSAKNMRKEALEAKQK